MRGDWAEVNVKRVVDNGKSLLTLPIALRVACVAGRGAIASYADALWARHAIFLPHERGGERLRDEPKERLRRRLVGLGREREV